MEVSEKMACMRWCVQVVKSAKQTQARKAKASGAGYADEDTKPAEQPKKCASQLLKQCCNLNLPVFKT